LDPLAHYLTIGRDRGFRPVGDSYSTWCKRFDVLDDEDRATILADLAARPLPPLCVLIYVDRANQDLLDRVVAAIDRQLASDWQVKLILATDCDVAAVEVAQRIAKGSPRYAVVSTAHTISDESVGSYTVCIFGGVLLREHALYMLARAAASISAVGLVYSD